MTETTTRQPPPAAADSLETGRHELPWTRCQAMALKDMEAAHARFTAPGVRALVQVFRDQAARTGSTRIIKAEFDPTRLGRWLDFAVFYDLSDSGNVTFRLVGEILKRRFRSNPTGRSYLDFVAPERRASALRAFHACANQPCAMGVQMRQTFTSGRQTECESFGVPIFETAADDRAAYLLFIDQPVDEARDWLASDRAMVHYHLRQRCFVDLGYGTPDGFFDLVQPPPA
jgi:hypothetical protein